jgi:hypothetical protein
MPREYQYRGRPVTPPEGLIGTDYKHLQTPTRSAILGARLISQTCNIRITDDNITQALGVNRRTQARVRKDNTCRTLHNSLHVEELEPRGRPRIVTRKCTQAIADYIDDETISIEDRGMPWLDISSACGFDLDVDP